MCLGDDLASARAKASAVADFFCLRRTAYHRGGTRQQHHHTGPQLQRQRGKPTSEQPQRGTPPPPANGSKKTATAAAATATATAGFRRAVQRGIEEKCPVGW